MPIYEYQCPSCGKITETLVQGFFATKAPKCPDCGHDTARRLSLPALVTETSHHSGKTCCGREERCEKPPCSGGGGCHRH